MNVQALCRKARDASRHMALLSNEAKDEILHNIAAALRQYKEDIVAANKKDVARCEKEKKPASVVDRLLLDHDRIEHIAADTMKVAQLDDYVGRIIEDRTLESGLRVQRVRVPLGVIGMIYEARPNVTVDATVLCLKSGNAVVLKGGSDALETNRVLVRVMRDVLKDLNMPEDAIGFIDTADRAATGELLEQREYVDVIIPRGGKTLIDFVAENSKIPVIETGASAVHTYVHEDANLEKAVAMVRNAKLRRVSVCNALDVLLLHKNIAERFLQAFVRHLPHDLEIRADKTAYGVLSRESARAAGLAGPAASVHARRSSSAKHDSAALLKEKLPPAVTLRHAEKNDFDTEFLDYILAVRVVANENEAIEHITQHNLRHSEAIIAESVTVAEKFLKMIDAACVYWNASTQFSDGAQFGLGAEIGISTQKLHARGPFALEGLTSYKWIVRGNGQVRP